MYINVNPIYRSDDALNQSVWRIVVLGRVAVQVFCVCMYVYECIVCMYVLYVCMYICIFFLCLAIFVLLLFLCLPIR